ncbi:MAG: hypothetical protein ACI9YM_001249 [Brevundimonas sp.]|jgi:uncharacterized protein|uniref:DUF418 domain-containing protein n=1 Tax=Brevundimonas sp. TaxID=1871086 RepID=UPI002487B3E3|nr:DUF418 domain-containing protein [Brevundimonas sp.]MDI1281376.1 DUF418 domain-containing protein [Brevundimonas sp.]
MTTSSADTMPPARADSSLAPVAPGDRIFNLDMLRGWAILGILAVNAMAFAWPIAVEFATGARPFAMDMANTTGDWVTTVFFQDKFRTLFTMLFGVSIFLVGGARDDEARNALLRRRLLWLGLFGLIHGLAFWYGDILLHYAYCGALMLLMRAWPARRLLWIGGGVTALWSVLTVAGALLGPVVMAAVGPEFATKAAASGPMATPAEVMAIVEQVRGGYGAALLQNLQAWVMVQGFSLFLIPASVPLMMIGLGLFKSGYLEGRAPAWLYGLMTLIGAANLALLGYAEGMVVTGGALPVEGLATAAAGCATLITLGYVSLLILMTRFGLKPLTAVLVPVGQMAFTNYLTQTLIMASLFYMPWGPLWYGTMGPGALWGVVAAVWLSQLIWSPLWLSRFRMGPLEWLWRCLSYGRWVPLLRTAA